MNTFLRSSLRVVFLAFATATVTSAGAAAPQGMSALGALAAQMQPGTFALLDTIVGFNGDLLRVDTAADFITQYADSMAWDPVRRRVLFEGEAHGSTFGARFMEYNPVHRAVLFGSNRNLYTLDAGGQITPLGSPPVDFTVLASNVSVDPVSGKYVVIDVDRKMYEYDLPSDTWTLLPTVAPSEFRVGDTVVEAPITTHGVIMYVAYGFPSKVYLYKHSPGGGGPPPPPPSGDTDGDGLPDAWEMTHFSSLAQGPGGDPDGDGAANLQEFRAGTDPTRAASTSSGGGGSDGDEGCGLLGLDAVLLLLTLVDRRKHR